MQERLAEIYPLNRRVSAAEVHQAEYFNQVLARQRAEIVEELSQCRKSLEDQRECADLTGIARLRRMIRAKESELATVDSLLEGLDARFRPSRRP